MGVFGAYSGSGTGSLVNPFSGTTAAESTAGVVPTFPNLYPEGDLRRYGAIGDGVTDDTDAINRWILVCQVTGAGYLSPATYATRGNHVVTTRFSMLGQGFGEFNGSPTSVPRFLLTADATNLFSWNGLNAAGPLVFGFKVSGVQFNGGNHTLSDALCAIQGVGIALWENCGFDAAVGKAIRVRQFWDSTFRNCMIRSVNNSADTNVGQSGVFHIDSIFNANLNNNVNNLTIDRCHFEVNRGRSIASAADSNSNIIRIINCKFETGILNPTPCPLIDLKNAVIVMISNNNFDQITDTNGYTTTFKLGDDTAGSVCDSYDIYDNVWASTMTVTTNYLITQGRRTSGRFHDNYQQGSNNRGLYTNTAAYANHFQYPKIFNFQADSSPALYDVQRSYNGYVNVQYLTFSSDFVVDAAATDAAHLTSQSAAAGAILATMLTTIFAGLPGSLRIGVRCKSATGNGTISVVANTTTLAAKQVTTTTFSVLWFDVTNDFLSIMGNNPSDRIRVVTGSGNAELVTLDGVYFMQVPWHYTASFTYDPASLLTLTQTSTTTTVTGAALGDHVDAYPPYDLQDIQCTACVSAANTVRISLFNATTGTIDLASGSWVVRVTKR